MKKRWWIVLVVIVVVAGLGYGGYTIFKNMTSENETVSGNGAMETAVVERGDLRASIDFYGVHAQVTFFVGEDTAALADSTFSHTVGTGLVARHGISLFASRNTRSGIKDTLGLIIGIDHSRGAGHHLNRALGNQAQRRFHADLVPRADSVDGSTDLIEAG